MHRGRSSQQQRRDTARLASRYERSKGRQGMRLHRCLLVRRLGGADCGWGTPETTVLLDAPEKPRSSGVSTRVSCGFLWACNHSLMQIASADGAASRPACRQRFQNVQGERTRNVTGVNWGTSGGGQARQLLKQPSV
jgi:hypothetical protein